MGLTIAQLADRLDAELLGAGEGIINGVAGIHSAGEDQVTFVRSGRAYGPAAGQYTEGRYISEIKNTRAGAIIVEKSIEGLNKPQLLVGNVDKALIEALRLFAPKLKPPRPGVAPTAKIAENARIANSASIGEYVVIDDGVTVGENTVIASGCRIGQNTTIGSNCRLDSNVVIYHNCRIGNNVIIQANTTIGSTGFGYSHIDGKHQLIPHNGGVVIEDFVEIGANCCVDRAKFDNTIIGAGTKIDNLVQIAHNVVIGRCCLIAGQVGISGSCRLGDGVVIGGQSGLVDNIEVGSGTLIGGKSGVTHNLKAGSVVLGNPALERKEALRALTLSKKLPKLVEQLKQLKDRISRIEASKDDKN